MSGCAWVTLATNDTYCLGALVLAHSLKKVSTRHQIAIITTPLVSPSMREQLSKVFDVVHTVDVLDSQDAANLALLQRPDLGVTFTKIHCWNLIQYSKCVFLDADTLVMQNCDELMEREELSAAPDPGWPDCFNSGVFVFVPSQDTFKQLIQFASTHGSFDGGDQGLLNMYFNDWPTSDIRKHLSFLYNMCSTSTYTYLPALKYYGANIKIVHFIGANKPWLLGPSGAGMSSFSQAWWDVFQSSVVQHLSKEMSGLAGALGSKERSAIEEQWRKQNWEQGNIDFTGKDSFENIWQKIMDAVNKPKAETLKPIEPLVPKEIASLAISEKEKADIPESSEAPKEEVKSSEPTEAQPLAPEEVKKDSTPLPAASAPEEAKKDSTPLPVASAPVELPKEDQKPPTSEEVKKDTAPLPVSVAPAELLKEDQKLPTTEEVKKDIAPLPVASMPIEIPKEDQKPPAPEAPKPSEPTPLPPLTPPTPAAETPKLPESPKPLEKGETVLPSGLDSKAEAPPSIPEPTKPIELPKAPEPLATGPTAEQPIITGQAVVAQQEPTKAGEPKLDLPQESGDLPKIEDILKGLEQTLLAELTDDKKDLVSGPLETPKIAAEALPGPEEQKKVEGTQAQPPAPQMPATETPKAPLADASKADAPLPEISKSEVVLPEAPKVEEAKQQTPESQAAPTPLPEAPKTSPAKPDEIKSDTPKPEALPQATEATSEVTKPVQQETSKPDAPKVEATPTAPAENVAAVPDVPKQEEPKAQAQSKPETEKVVPIPAESKETTTESKNDEGKKQKEGQKPAKQQAPQPPPKNGKQKKGQQPEPTTAHPLAETPIQVESAKELKTAPQEPLTPPTSPDSQPKEPESQVKGPECQPGTPTVTAPTPPVTPSDAFKVEDPLSAQIKSDENVSTTGSSTGGADVPVPPKRKGKGNEKQPPKPQNNGGKGKGKK